MNKIWVISLSFVSGILITLVIVSINNNEDVMIPLGGVEQTGDYIIAPIEDFNLDRVQHEIVRKKIDLRYKVVHDELSQAYYNSLPFDAYGILDEITFSKLQSALWAEYEVLFDQTNKKLPKKDRIPEEKYNIIYELVDGIRTDTGKRKNVEALNRINQFKNESIEISL